MKPDSSIEYSERLEAAIQRADQSEVAGAADSCICFDADSDDVQGIFDAGWEVALKLAVARLGGADDARVYFGDDEDSDYRFFFIATSEDEAVARVAALKPAPAYAPVEDDFGGKAGGD